MKICIKILLITIACLKGYRIYKSNINKIKNKENIHFIHLEECNKHHNLEDLCISLNDKSIMILGK